MYLQHAHKLTLECGMPKIDKNYLEYKCQILNAFVAHSCRMEKALFQDGMMEK